MMLVIPTLIVVEDYEYAELTVVQPTVEMLSFDNDSEEIKIGCVQQPKWN